MASAEGAPTREQPIRPRSLTGLRRPQMHLEGLLVSLFWTAAVTDMLRMADISLRGDST